MGADVAIGTILGPVLANLTGNWQTGLAYEAGVTVAALIMAVIVAVGPKPPVADFQSSESENLGDMAKEVKTAILQPATISALICAFGLAWIFQAMGDLTPSYLAIDPPVGLEKGALVAGSIYSVFSFAYMISAVGSQFFTDKVFKGSTRNTILVGFIASAVTVFGGVGGATVGAYCLHATGNYLMGLKKHQRCMHQLKRIVQAVEYNNKFLIGI